MDGWTYTGPWTGSDLPRYVGADRAGAARYRDGKAAVEVYVARYAAQRQGAELVNFFNSPAGRDATVLARRAVGDGDAPVPAEELRVRQGFYGQRVVWYSYSVAGWHTASPLAAKVYQALGRLRRRTDASVLVLSATCDSDCRSARTALASFARRAAPMILRGGNGHSGGFSPPRDVGTSRN
jgi:EpsI family protein